MSSVERLQPEQWSEPIVAVPITEILEQPARVGSVWPNYAENANFMNQITEHAEQVRTIYTTLDRLPLHTQFEQVVTDHAMSEQEAVQFYTTLSELLANTDTVRLALYLPFECLPHADWQPETPELQASSIRLQDAYLHAWHRLLGVHDVRANFVDGDVLEPELRGGDIPRIVKAAHLLPLLMAKGYVSETYADSLIATADNTVLQRSLAEGLAAAYNHDVPVASDHTINAAVTERRRQWLADKAAYAEFSVRTDQIANAIVHSQLSQPGHIESMSAHTDRELSEGIYRAIERCEDSTQARSLYASYVDTLNAMWSVNDGESKQQLTGVFRRLHHLGIVSEAALTAYGIAAPDLAAPFSENVRRIERDTDMLRTVTAAIEADPLLSQYLYPALLVGGSKLKGYGKAGSDLDVSVFVRPGTDGGAREHIRTLLSGMYTLDEPIEFWLADGNDGSLAVREDIDTDSHMADRYWSHLLFGGAWIGDTNVIHELQQRLLPAYFKTPTDAPSAQSRQWYLERLEQDVLQYRLMHAGYAWHYPVVAREPWAHHTAIDGQGVFWDPGYRRLATKLFVRHVFLPRSS